MTDRLKVTIMINPIDKKFFKIAIGLDNIRKDSDVDISARCPHCSSDPRWKHTSRLHLYEKNGITQVNCFTGDCSVKNKTVYSFLRDFYPNLLDKYKREMFGNTMQKLAAGDTDVFSNIKQKKSEELTSKEQEVLVHDLTAHLTPIENSPDCLAYLETRGLPYDESKFGKWYYGHQDLKIGDITYKITNSVIIPLYYNKVMYGFYSRNITQKDFYTYNPECNLGYKIWNWFSVDKTKPVYIYEGIFDAISGGLENSIALMGAQLPPERLKELEHPVFVLDNDKTGFLNSIKYCYDAEVYIQPEKYTEKDMNQLMLNHKELNISELVVNNLYSGINAEITIKSKL